VIVTAVVVPQPPLLVPELVGGAVSETAELRAACEAAARRLVAAGAMRWLAVGVDDSGPRTVPASANGTFAGYGVHVPVSLAAPSAGSDGSCPSVPPLPLPLLVAGWLRARVDGAATVIGELVHPLTLTDECAERGQKLVDELAGVDEPVGLLVLGDGANTHPAPGAGRVDERAGPFDDTVRAALAGADTGALLDLDAELAAELGATGRAAWQVLAGAASGLGVPWQGELLYSGAPYGVAYHVAVWRPG
jgi:hypothetical protein